MSVENQYIYTATFSDKSIAPVHSNGLGDVCMAAARKTLHRNGVVATVVSDRGVVATVRDGTVTLAR
jgi:hypothetical protein